jgi:hypothetical protein
MTNDAHRTIWCLVKGYYVPFRISAPIDATVDELKVSIKARNENGACRGIDALNLVLRKVST